MVKGFNFLFLIKTSGTFIVFIHSGGSRISQRAGRRLQMWAWKAIIRLILSQQLHENERNWTDRGGAFPLDPPVIHNSVADPGFPRCLLQPKRGRMSTYYLVNLFWREVGSRSLLLPPVTLRYPECHLLNFSCIGLKAPIIATEATSARHRASKLPSSVIRV